MTPRAWASAATSQPRGVSLIHSARTADLLGSMATRLALIVLIAAELLWSVWQHQHSEREKAVAAIDGGEADGAATESATKQEPAPAQSYYRFIDGTGTLRFVDSLDKVPDAYRASARKMATK